MRNLFYCTTLAFGLGTVLLAQQAPPVAPTMTYHGVSDSLFNLALQARAPDAPFAPTEMVQKHGPLVDVETDAIPTFNIPSPGDTISQSGAPRALTAVAGQNFEGPGTGMPGFVLTGAPPDTTMAVGPSHIVAWVNSQFVVLNKTGGIILGPLNGNTIFAGMGNVCATTNRGDPILQYDKLADRWILSQFAFNVTGGNPSAPYLQCFAVSTTNNPTGTWFTYSLTFSSVSPSGFNDYGKIGVWPDGYYTSYNVFGGTPAGNNTGAGLCVSERVKMLVGDPTAKTLCAPITFYGGGAAFLPLDLEGTALPTDQSQGGVFIRFSTAPALRLVKLKADFPNNTVTIGDGFGGNGTTFINLGLGATTRACNGSGGTCVPQLGTTNTLDTLGDRLMYRASYRNRGGLDSMVVTHAVDPDGAGARTTVLRWYEIRSPLTQTPSLYQNSNFDPGGTSERWMGSIASDKMGNMLAGYSISSAAMNPSLRIAGRLRTDTRNSLQGESTVVNGTGSQTGTLTRWGDYTTMQLDPGDDCTFWYIGQYLSANGTFNWRTRVASFKFNNCN